MKAIIVDDETAATNGLMMLIEKHVAALEIIAGTSDCYEGMKLIETHKPDVVFLDVSMPEMNGLSFLNELNWTGVNLVFVTDHERYAIKAIRHHATDYLLKPVDIDDLKSAVENIKGLRASVARNDELIPAPA